MWTYAFLLTETKVYTYKNCDFNLRNNATAVLTPACRRHLTTMIHCRTDASDALSSASWFWFPYPFQWGVPTFHWQTAVVMIVASVIASVDSVRSSFQRKCERTLQCMYVGQCRRICLSTVMCAGWLIPCNVFASSLKSSPSRCSEPRHRDGRCHEFLGWALGHWSRCEHIDRECAHNCCDQDGQPKSSGIWGMCIDHCLCYW